MKHYKPFFILLAVFSFGTLAMAQQPTDKVVKKDGTTIAAILTDITVEEIKFKKASYPTGPTYTLPLKEVKKIILATGEEEVFDEPEEIPKDRAKPIDSTPFGAEKFMEYSADGQSIITDLTLPDNNRYLCIWNLDLELIKKIQIPRYWRSYSQQVTNSGNYLDQSIYYDTSGTELKRFKQKMFGVSFELSGFKYPSIVSPTGNRFIVNEHIGDDREDLYLYNEKGEFVENYHSKTMQGFRFSHKNDMFYVITYSVSKDPVHITIYDPGGKEVGRVKVKTIMNNVSFFEEDKTIPQFSFDDQYIVTKTTYEHVIVADVKGNVIRRLYQPMSNAMAFSRDGKKIVTAGNTYFGNKQKIEDENGNKIEYSGGSIKIWSFEGTLLKEVDFPARVDYIQFTPDNDGVAVLIGDVGATLWLWEKNDYKLPDGFEKTVLEIAKYQNQKREQKIKESRLNFWVDMAENTYNTLSVGGAKVQSEKNRLQGEQKKAFELNKKIAERNNPKPATKSTGSGGCLYEYEIIETRVEGKLTALKMSNIYTVPSTSVARSSSQAVTFNPTGDIHRYFVFPSWAEANKAVQKQGTETEDKYDFDLQPLKRADQCK